METYILVGIILLMVDILILVILYIIFGLFNSFHKKEIKKDILKENLYMIYDHNKMSSDLYLHCYNYCKDYDRFKIRHTKAFLKQDIGSIEIIGLIIAIAFGGANELFVDVTTNIIKDVTANIINIEEIAEEVKDIALSIWVILWVILIVFVWRRLKKETYLLHILEDMDQDCNKTE